MIVKFKREDLGLYVALALVGGGLGLAAGAIIAARLKKRKILVKGVALGWEHTDEYGVRFASSAFDNDDTVLQELRNTDGYDINVTVEEIDQGETFDEIRKMKDIELEKRLQELIERYDNQPTVMELGMVRAGLVTLEELEERLIERALYEDVEPYSYSGQYQRGRSTDEKPDLDELVENWTDDPLETEKIGDRFLILYDDPKHLKFDREYEYDPEGPVDVWRFLSGRGNPVSVSNISSVVPPMMWPEMRKVLLDRKELCVEDLNSGRKYRFYIGQDDESGDVLDEEDVSAQ